MSDTKTSTIFSKSKIPPLKTNQNDKVLIGDELDDSESVELLCPTCHTNTIVTISDGVGNSDLFCKRCSTVYNQEDDILRHRQRLLPPEEPEPAASTTPTIGADDVAIRHEKELVWGAKEISRKGTIKFTHYQEGVG